MKKMKKARAIPNSGTERDTGLRGYGSAYPKAQMFWQSRGDSMRARPDDHHDTDDARQMNVISKAMRHFSNIVSTNATSVRCGVQAVSPTMLLTSPRTVAIGVASSYVYQ